jgi:methylenetetrahydrofolate reductase (NADPH)
MEVAALYADRKNWPVFSAETFPTENFRPIDSIFDTVEALLPHGIRVVTTTWGALGSSRGATASISRILHERFHVPTVVHLSIQAKSKQDIENILRGLHYDGLHNVLALGGDPPEGHVDYVPEEFRHHHASDLVEQITKLNNGRWLGPDGTYSREGVRTHFGIGVAVCPEIHPEDFHEDCDFDTNMKRYLGHLKIKLAAGSHYAIEQMIFDADIHFRFARAAREAGIQTPIIPGILPFERYGEVARFIGSRLRVSMPAELQDALQKAPERQHREIAEEHMSGVVRKLLEGGVPGIHFYCMNKSAPTIRLLHRARA